MRAAVIREYGGPENVRVEPIPRPSAEGLDLGGEENEASGKVVLVP